MMSSKSAFSWNEANIREFTDTQLNGYYKEILEEFSALLKRAGKDMRPYLNEVPEFFNARPISEKYEAFFTFNRYFNVILEIEKEHNRIDDDKVILWRMLKRLELSPTSDFFSKLENDDIIEIYDTNNVQVYRNLTFFNLVSYSLDEILNRTWYELYFREKSIEEKLFGLCKDIFMGTEHTIKVDKFVPTHVVEDLGSSLPSKNYIYPRYLSALYTKDKQIGGLIHTFKSKPVK